MRQSEYENTANQNMAHLKGQMQGGQEYGLVETQFGENVLVEEDDLLDSQRGVSQRMLAESSDSAAQTNPSYDRNLNVHQVKGERGADQQRPVPMPELFSNPKRSRWLTSIPTLPNDWEAETFQRIEVHVLVLSSRLRFKANRSHSGNCSPRRMPESKFLLSIAGRPTVDFTICVTI